MQRLPARARQTGEPCRFSQFGSNKLDKLDQVGSAVTKRRVLAYCNILVKCSYRLVRRPRCLIILVAFDVVAPRASLNGLTCRFMESPKLFKLLGAYRSTTELRVYTSIGVEMLTVKAELLPIQIQSLHRNRNCIIVHIHFAIERLTDIVF